ncbi:MAG: (d)CMP kinase [Bacteroidia bacterium]|nr:(d)CMP kinase [Bacteroidia bacterium]
MHQASKIFLIGFMGSGKSTAGRKLASQLNWSFIAGLTIYLKMTPACLKRRLTKLSERRPLLKDIDRKDLLGYITSKLEEREKWYLMAKIIVDGFNTDLSDLLSLIKKQIR